MTETLDKYQALSTNSLQEVIVGGDLTDARDFLWGLKNGLKGRKRHHCSWRDRRLSKLKR